VDEFAGGGPRQQPEHYAESDPTLLVPATCPVWAVHAADDQVVPVAQALSYVTHARAAGARAETVTVPGDHFSLIDPQAPSFPTIRQLVTRARA
jgi:dipeptidyl aminopeptidase/acylaminoacyl peptidase